MFGCLLFCILLSYEYNALEILASKGQKNGRISRRIHSLTIATTVLTSNALLERTESTSRHWLWKNRKKSTTMARHSARNDISIPRVGFVGSPAIRIRSISSNILDRPGSTLNLSIIWNDKVFRNRPWEYWQKQCLEQRFVTRHMKILWRGNWPDRFIPILKSCEISSRHIITIFSCLVSIWQSRNLDHLNFWMHQTL